MGSFYTFTVPQTCYLTKKQNCHEYDIRRAHPMAKCKKCTQRKFMQKKEKWTESRRFWVERLTTTTPSFRNHRIHTTPHHTTPHHTTPKALATSMVARVCFHTRYTIHDTRYTIPDTRYPIPDTRYTIPDTRCTIHDSRYTIHDTRYNQNVGYFRIVFGVIETFHSVHKGICPLSVALSEAFPVAFPKEVRAWLTGPDHGNNTA